MPLARWWIPAISLLSLVPRDAAAICREVTEKGSPPPAITPDQELLVIKRTGVPVGCEQPPDPDGGAPDGGLPPGDAGGGDGPGDAGSPDAGGRDGGAAGGGGGEAGDGGAGDAGTADAGTADAGPCQPHIGDTVTWIVQPRFSIGPDGSRFALLMVTPAPPVVDTAPESTFLDLAATTAPREVVQERYIEDRKLGYQCEDPKFGGGGGASTGCGGVGLDSGGWEPPDPSGEGAADAGTPDGYIRVNTVGSYHVAILSVRDGAELADWLDRAEYHHDGDDIAALQPYLEAGWIVTAVRVSSDHAVESGGLEPLSFTFEGTDMRLPLGVAHQPEGGRALLRIYVAAEGRYELPGAAPLYADWVPDERPTFLTATVLDFDLSRTADMDPVASRALTDAVFRDEYTVTREIRIPSSECPRDDDPGLCNCRAGGSAASQLGTLLMAATCAAFVLRRRRR